MQSSADGANFAWRHLSQRIIFSPHIQPSWPTSSPPSSSPQPSYACARMGVSCERAHGQGTVCVHACELARVSVDSASDRVRGIGQTRPATASNWPISFLRSRFVRRWDKFVRCIMFRTVFVGDIRSVVSLFDRRDTVFSRVGNECLAEFMDRDYSKESLHLVVFTFLLAWCGLEKFVCESARYYRNWELGSRCF